jgi:hypothetical protein
VIGRSVARSPSIYPDDPDSAHYDPLVYALMDEKVTPRDDFPVLEEDASTPAGASEPEVAARPVERMPPHPQLDKHIRTSNGGHESGGETNDPPELPPFLGDR